MSSRSTIVLPISRNRDIVEAAIVALDKLDLGIYRPAGSDESDPTTPTGQYSLPYVVMGLIIMIVVMQLVKLHIQHLINIAVLNFNFYSLYGTYTWIPKGNQTG